MPGMIGLAGSDGSLRDEYLRRFSEIWGGPEQIDTLEFDRGFVSGHSFPPFSAVRRLRDGSLMAVDGEASLYRMTDPTGHEEDPVLFRKDDDGITLREPCKGNIALVDGSRLYIAAEPSGLFPLYYCHAGNALLFGSHIRPLAGTVGAEIDPIGVCQFIRFRHIYHDRSLYKGIKRLLPGQVLAMDLDSNVASIRETSETWTRRFDESDREGILDRYITALKSASAGCFDEAGTTAIMMSGGWDSKVLLASMIDVLGPDRIFGYSHGGVTGRELKIAARIMTDHGIEHHLENIDDRTFVLDSIEERFNRVENAVFPHWLRAGMLLKEKGASAVTAGILGEVGGGHYTTAWTMPRWRQGLNVGIQLMNLGRLVPRSLTSPAPNIGDVYDYLSIRSIAKPRTVSMDFWNSAPDLVDQINSDIHSHLGRLESRGVKHPDQLVEALLTETRGSQYIGAQLRICRSSLDVASVYGDMEHLKISSWIPSLAKVHNIIGKGTLRKIAPRMLDYPTAATLIPNRYPIIMQEAARVARRAYETAAMALRRRTKGKISPGLVAWHDFEFLRDGRILRDIAGSYRSDIFDREACSGYIDEVQGYIYPYELYNVQNDMMTAYTIDRILG
jgi:hypothetical protein